MIQYGRQSIDEEDIQAVVDTLKSPFLTQGPAVKKFEQEVAQTVQSKYAVACNSGTSALVMACQALGVSKSDNIWTTANSFAASSNCALLLGANVDFVDIDPATYNISSQALAEKLELAAEQQCLPKVVIVVHFGGLPAALDEIALLAKQYQFKIIEDASHAIGASFNNSPIGSCQYSEMTTFSFHPVKHVTTAEGGAVTTNSLNYLKKLQLACSHGITKDPEQLLKRDMPAWYYEQQSISFNFRLPDLLAALGSSQLKKLSIWLAHRKALALNYHKLLADLPVSIQITQGLSSAWHLFVISLAPELHKFRDEIFNSMRTAGIGVNVHYIPIYLHPYYQNKGFTKGYCPAAENYFNGAITLPLHQTLTFDEQIKVVDTLKLAIKEVTESHHAK